MSWFPRGEKLRARDRFPFRPCALLTVTLEPLSDQPKQHLSTVVTEGWGPVRVHVEGMRPNLEIFKRGCR